MTVRHFRGRDGVQLAYRELGEGRPVVLMHGFQINATVNWLDHGTAAVLAEQGRRVILPDLRAHGDSAKPRDPAAYPPDVLADDGFALLDHLGLTDYDLGGYSLGGQVAVRMLVRGATPGRAVVGGVGLDRLVPSDRVRGEKSRQQLTGTFEPGTPGWQAQEFLRQTGGDPVALLRVLDAQLDTPLEALTAISVPTLVLAAVDDERTAAELAEVLPKGTYAEVPGNHFTALTHAEFGAAIVQFLAEGDSD